MTTESIYTDVYNRRQLYYRNGYRPVAINNGKKFPLEKQWQITARFDPPLWCQQFPVAHKLCTGILADGLRPIDIDVDDSALCEQLAAFTLQCFGNAPVRYRKGCSRLIILYAAEGEPAKAAVKNKITGHGVEVLGKGNQFFADGKHPSGEPVCWLNGPESVPRAELTVITQEQVITFIDEIRHMIDGDRYSYGIHAPVVASHAASVCPIIASRRVTSVETPCVPSGMAKMCLADIEDALRVIPNYGRDYETWWRIGAAVYHASGGATDAYKAWFAWSAQSPAHNGADTLHAWQHYGSVNRITTGTLWWYAKQADANWHPPSSSFTPINIFKKGIS